MEETPLRSCSPVLKADIPIKSELIDGISQLKILLLDSEGRGYDTLAIGIQTIRVGELSEWLKMEFKVAKNWKVRSQNILERREL